MSLSIAKFIEGLSQIGLLPPAEIEALKAAQADKLEADADALAHELVEQGKLSRFQAANIYQGRTEALVLGNYLVLDKVGAGGMGRVYRAQHRKMDRVVAVKVLPKKMLSSPESVERFRREVKAAGRLSHPNIVIAFDADEAAGTHFLVMEYVEGLDLSQLVKQRGPLPIAEAVEYVRQAACGLEQAHAEGVVHRDIKPSNLLVDKRGTVKILDMGLARIDEPSDGALDDVETRAELTQQGSIMGTIDFMAPEQAADTHRADMRCDLYSLGCTLHYLLIGRAPFGGDTLVKRLLAHRDEPIPSLRALRPEVAPALDAVFQRLMAKRPEERYQTAGELLDALRKSSLAARPIVSATLVKGPLAAAKPVAVARSELRPRASVSRKLGVMLASVAAVSLAAVAWICLQGTGQEPQPSISQPQSPMAQTVLQRERPVKVEPAETVEATSAAIFGGSPKSEKPRTPLMASPVAVVKKDNLAADADLPLLEPTPTPVVAALARAGSAEVAAPETEAADTVPDSPDDSSLPIPDTASIAKADALIKDIYKDDLAAAKTDDAKLSLAEKLLRQADETKDDHAGRYAILCRARDLAIDGGSPAVADEAIRSLAASFEVDAQGQLSEALEKITAKAHPAATYQAVAQTALQQGRELANVKQWDPAKRFTDLALNAARKVKDPELIKQLTEQRKNLAAEKKQWEAIQAAKETLKTTPDDPAAHLAVGKYLCFVEGDWTAGLEHLARSSDATFKGLATKSMAAPDEPAAQLALGDAWWDAAETLKGKEKDELRAAAGYWYSLAVESLTGLVKTRVEKRLSEIGIVTGNKIDASSAGGRKPAGAANGLYVPQTLDCEKQYFEFPVKPTFDAAKSWTLAFEFWPPNFDKGTHHIFRFGEATKSGGRNTIDIQLYGSALNCSVGDGTDAGRGSYMQVKTDPQLAGTWISIVYRYEAASNENLLFINGKFVRRRLANPRPASMPGMQVYIGTGDLDKLRFYGRVRSVWLSNQEKFTLPDSPDLKPAGGAAPGASKPMSELHGKPPVKPANQDQAQFELERAVAEQVIAIDGRVKVSVNGAEPLEFRKDNTLPDEPFLVTSVWLYTRKKVSSGLFADIGRLTRIVYLNLSYTNVTEENLPQISKLESLESLVLVGDPVTDAALDQLAMLKNLRLLGLDKTQITDEGAARLQQALPNCKINR